jgi:hypothetical protein
MNNFKKVFVTLLTFYAFLFSAVLPAYSIDYWEAVNLYKRTSQLGGQANKITNTAVSYTAKVTDYYIRVTNTDSARTITLPTAVGNKGMVLVIADASGAAETNAVTIDGNASELVGTALTIVISKNYGRVVIESNNASWDIIADHSSKYSFKRQPTPAAKTGAATVTIADMLKGIITLSQSTGATVALTTNTGAEIEAGLPPGFAVGDSFDFSIINISAAALDTGTLTAGASGVTIVGAVIIPSGHSTTIASSSMHYRVLKTGTETYVIYRVG